ncbi:PREDICTED: muscle M-line assembly protein unc-89-like, partial [Cyprinodon variegatus]|uniref:muscle M-line assembly protein unc-89-like n=1 Tax=Cyprinodon variegatus TaxID=28743 RepID=UPI000742C766
GAQPGSALMALSSFCPGGSGYQRMRDKPTAIKPWTLEPEECGESKFDLEPNSTNWNCPGSGPDLLDLLPDSGSGGTLRSSEMVLVLVLVLVVSLKVSAVEKSEGESVLLLCEFPTDELDQPTVFWSRSDLSPSVVHRRSAIEDQLEVDQLQDQNQLFRGRTSMQPDALKTGDLSLNLTNLQVSDSGTYTCSIRTSREEWTVTEGELLVNEPPVWPWVLLGFLIPVVLLVGPAAVWYYRWKKKHTEVLQSEIVEIREGVKSVLLPLKANRTFPRDARVEWTRYDQNIRVHVFKNGQTQPEEQEKIYEGRTKMRAERVTTGDLSLTLKRPQLEDNGDYECVVYRGGDLLLKKTVTLKVKESLMEEVEVTEGEDVVHLPFKTLANLPQDAKVVWSHTDKPDKVHQYQNGQNQLERQNREYQDRTAMNPDALQTGDLTLTLKDPRLGDSGIYICIVYDNDGKILRRKVVTLTVRVYKVEKVSVDEGKRSVVLPFHATPSLLSESITVEWRLSDVEDTMLYKYQRGHHIPAEDQVYGGHTEMNKDPLTTGDLSLTIRDLRLTDGVYTCTIYDENEERLQQKVVVLIVRDLQMEIVEVPKREAYVTLPFKIQPPEEEDLKIRWIHAGSKQSEVITFENGELQVSQYSKLYRRHIKMDKDLLSSGDLSLILKHPGYKDNGLYKCTVYSGQKIQQEKMVTLSVKDPLDSSFLERLQSHRRSRRPAASSLE